MGGKRQELKGFVERTPPKCRVLLVEGDRGVVGDKADIDMEANFGELMQQAINQVNETQMQASSLTRAFELGENVDLSQVMIAVQKSRVSFEALTQVRNKLLTAYQDVMNMSV